MYWVYFNSVFDAKFHPLDTIGSTFYHSKKYKELAKNTKASLCITSQALKTELPNSCTPLIVDNVLVAVSKLTTKFYPDAVNDNFDETAKSIDETEFKDKVKHGKNVLVGKNVAIGSNCSIGHNTIVEKNVSIGNNCSIGSNTVIRNTIIKNNVIILDNCVIGKHGFGFFPVNNNSFGMILWKVVLCIFFVSINHQSWSHIT